MKHHTHEDFCQYRMLEKATFLHTEVSLSDDLGNLCTGVHCWQENVGFVSLFRRDCKVESVSIGGSVVECSPATRAARVRFPADASDF